MQEKRYTQQLVSYWNEIRHGSDMPDMDSFSPHNIARIWDNCMVISVHPTDDDVDYIYQYVGQDLVRVFGSDPTGHQVLQHIPHMPTARIMSAIEENLQVPKPVMIESEFLDKDGCEVKYRAALVPFGHNRGRITHFVTVLSWKT